MTTDDRILRAIYELSVRDGTPSVAADDVARHTRLQPALVYRTLNRLRKRENGREPRVIYTPGSRWRLTIAERDRVAKMTEVVIGEDPKRDQEALREAAERALDPVDPVDLDVERAVADAIGAASRAWEVMEPVELPDVTELCTTCLIDSVVTCHGIPTCTECGETYLTTAEAEERVVTNGVERNEIADLRRKLLGATKLADERQQLYVDAYRAAMEHWATTDETLPVFISRISGELSEAMRERDELRAKLDDEMAKATAVEFRLAMELDQAKASFEAYQAAMNGIALGAGAKPGESAGAFIRRLAGELKEERDRCEAIQRELGEERERADQLQRDIDYGLERLMVKSEEAFTAKQEADHWHAKYKEAVAERWDRVEYKMRGTYGERAKAFMARWLSVKP